MSIFLVTAFRLDFYSPDSTCHGGKAGVQGHLLRDAMPGPTDHLIPPLSSSLPAFPSASLLIGSWSVLTVPPAPAPTWNLATCSPKLVSIPSCRDTSTAVPTVSSALIPPCLLSRKLWGVTNSLNLVLSALVWSQTWPLRVHFVTLRKIIHIRQGWCGDGMRRSCPRGPITPSLYPHFIFLPPCLRILAQKSCPFDKKGIGLADSGPFSNGTLAKSLVFFEPVSSSARMGAELLVSVFGYAL